jgi:hypothetical protein
MSIQKHKTGKIYADKNNDLEIYMYQYVIVVFINMLLCVAPARLAFYLWLILTYIRHKM